MDVIIFACWEIDLNYISKWSFCLYEEIPRNIDTFHELLWFLLFRASRFNVTSFIMTTVLSPVAPFTNMV